MRLRPPPTDAPPLRWIPRASLPASLRAAVARHAALEPLRGPLGAWWLPAKLSDGALLLGGMTLAALMPALASAPALGGVVAPLALAGVAGWVARQLDRPRVGPSAVVAQGAHLSSASLVLVDRDAVAVVQAEHLERRANGWWYGPALLDDAAHPAAWTEALDASVRRAQADPDARASDPWRALSPLAVHASLTAARSRHLARVGAAALGGFLVAITAQRALPALGAAWASARSPEAPPRSAPAPAESTRWNEPPQPMLAAAVETVAAPEAPDARPALRRAALAGDERALRRLLSLEDPDRVPTAEARGMRERLDAICASRFGVLPTDAPGERAIRMTLELRCRDPAELLPLVTVIRRCVAGGEAVCDPLPDAEGRLTRELAEHLERQLAALGAAGPVRFRPMYGDDTFYVRVEHSEAVTSAPRHRGEGPVFAGTVTERADLARRGGVGIGRLAAPWRSVIRVPVESLGPALRGALDPFAPFRR